VVRNNPTAPAAATGITQTGTYLGAMAGPLVFGWVVDTWSYREAWLAGTGWYVCGAVAMLVGRALLRRAGTPGVTARASTPEPGPEGAVA